MALIVAYMIIILINISHRRVRYQNYMSKPRKKHIYIYI